LRDSNNQPVNICKIPFMHVHLTVDSGVGVVRGE
jgi:hypothetical protein